MGGSVREHRYVRGHLGAPVFVEGKKFHPPPRGPHPGLTRRGRIPSRTVVAATLASMTGGLLGELTVVADERHGRWWWVSGGWVIAAARHLLFDQPRSASRIRSAVSRTVPNCRAT